MTIAAKKAPVKRAPKRQLKRPLKQVRALPHKPATKLSAADAAALSEAVGYLDTDGLIVRISSMLGETAAGIMARIPAPLAELIAGGYTGVVQTVTDRALQSALWLAAQTLNDVASKPSWDRAHKIGAAVTGAVGGFFGLAGAAVEVPITTVIMFRSILDIARGEGADIMLPETRVECLNVLAFGGVSNADDNSETEYFLARAGLANLGSQAAQYLATRQGKKAVLKVAGKLASYMGRIGMRYAPIVAEKISMEGVPVIGALGGAVINAAFVGFFQDVARGHFTVLRLERKYGPDLVRAEFERLRARRR